MQEFRRERDQNKADDATKEKKDAEKVVTNTEINR
jgi:hypothetical protein